MPDAVSQSSSTPGDGTTVTPPAAPGNGDGTQGQPTTTTPPATKPADGTFDPTALSKDQLDQILEKNPEIWKTDRLADLRDKAAKFTKLTAEQQKAADEKLIADKKFEELSTQHAQTIEGLTKQLQESNTNQALVNKLSPLGVVDLEAALKLVDRSKITVGDDGTVSGIDEAVESLKTDKAYLFTGTPGKPQVGTPTNPGNGAGSNETPKFKASQMRGPEGAQFYQDNREEILKAQALGQIEQD